MKIQLSSIMVDDQEKALKFYTESLGFIKKSDIPVGNFRWLTVVSPDNPEGTELVLEPMGFPEAVAYQKALYDTGIPLTALMTEDIFIDYYRLKKAGVLFRSEPQNMGGITAALFEDTCGNLINLVQPAD